MNIPNADTKAFLKMISTTPNIQSHFPPFHPAFVCCISCSSVSLTPEHVFSNHCFKKGRPVSQLLLLSKLLLDLAAFSNSAHCLISSGIRRKLTSTPLSAQHIMRLCATVTLMNSAKRYEE